MTEFQGSFIWSSMSLSKSLVRVFFLPSRATEDILKVSWLLMRHHWSCYFCFTHVSLSIKFDKQYQNSIFHAKESQTLQYYLKDCAINVIRWSRLATGDFGLRTTRKKYFFCGWNRFVWKLLWSSEIKIFVRNISRVIHSQQSSSS